MNEPVEVFYTSEEFSELWKRTIEKISFNPSPYVNISEDTIWLDDIGISIEDNSLFIRIKSGLKLSNGFVRIDDEKDQINFVKIPFWKRIVVKRKFSNIIKNIQLNKKLSIKNKIEKEQFIQSEDRKYEINKFFGVTK